MADTDRQRWDRRWTDHPGPGPRPASVLLAWADRLPTRGRALDVASGPGRNARWLAERGLDTTAVDVSPVALRALAAALPRVRTVALDLEAVGAGVASLPAGPWDLVVCTDYLQRDLFPVLREALAPGGWLLFSQPTPRNLERHPRPGRRFLVEVEELPSLAEGLTVLQSDAAWREPPDGGEARHEARLVGRRPERSGS